MGKQLAAGLLAALLGACMMAGCSSKPYSPKNPISIEIWHYYNGPQKLTFDSMISEFNETVGMKEGITVEAFSQGGINELTEKLLAAANKKVGAQEVPDVFAAYADAAYQMDQLGLAAELDPYLTEEELEEYIPEYLEEGRFDGKALKIFPIAKSTEIMMLNKTDWDRFAQESGAQLEELSTMEGLIGVAQRYYDWSGGKAFFGWDAMANYFLIGARQLGMEIFDAQNGQVTYHLDEDVMRRLWENYYVPYVNGWFTAKGRFRSDDAKTGDLIALVGSTSGAAYFPEVVMVDDNESYPIESIVLPPPMFEGGKKTLVQQGAGLVVAKSDEAHERASIEFLRWFTDAQRNIKFSVGSGYLPVKRAANDVSLLEEVFAQNTDLTTGIRQSITTAVSMVASGEYEMYTSRVFQGGTQARAVLENSLIDLAKQDREALLKLAEGGTPVSEAAAGFCTDESFRRWLSELQVKLEEAVR